MGKINSAPLAPTNTPKSYISMFYCFFMPIGAIVDLFSTKLSIWTLKCWFLTAIPKFEIFKGPDIKMCQFEMASKCILIVSLCNDLVKFLKNLQNFLKRCLRRRFGRFSPENPKTLHLKPTSAKNAAIEPPQGGEPSLYLVLGRSKGLWRCLMHPCYQRPWKLTLYILLPN